MEFTHFMGVDVSKETLDITIRQAEFILVQETIANSVKNIHQFFKTLFSKKQVSKNDLLICLEHTGIYSSLLLKYAGDSALSIWVEDAVQIKQVMKAHRGKSDKLDACQIAEYAYRFPDRVKLWEPERTAVKILSRLIAQRRRLINIKKSLVQPLNETKRFEEKEIVQLEEKLNNSIIKQIEKQIKEVEIKIEQTITSDTQLNQLYKLITSVDGIGPVIASHMLVYTNEFKRFCNAKKLACHAGVVPFDHKSGSSIKGKPTVSHRANKTLKSLFHMAAITAIKRKGELQNYYLRKVAEGKNKMSVINALRNKLILRIYACVRDNRPYEKIIQLSIV